MKRLLLLILLASPCIASSPKRSFEDPRLNDELDNVYFQIDSLLKASPVRISSAAITTATITNLIASVTGAVIQSSCAIQVTQTTTTSSTYQSTLLVVTTNALRATTSKVLILVSGTIGFAETIADNTEYVTVFNGSTNLANAQGMSSFDGTTAMVINNLPTAFVWVDAPASTSAQTYTVKIKSADNATTVRWNNATGSSIMCVLELGL